jgi:hypothetical protein
MEVKDDKLLQEFKREFFHFCGTLGRPYQVQGFPVMLCPVCHKRALNKLDRKDIYVLLKRYEKEARAVWDKAPDHSEFISEMRRRLLF